MISLILKNCGGYLPRSKNTIHKMLSSGGACTGLAI